LEIREKPSSWERQVRQVKLESENELSRFRREFWEYYGESFPNDFDLKPGYRHSNVWYEVEGTDLIISQFLAPASGRVGVYVRGQAGESQEDAQNRVKPFVARLQNELGAELGKNHSIGSDLRVDPMDREKWESIAEWLHDTLVSFRNILEGDPA
jgi:hypothetical protein